VHRRLPAVLAQGEVVVTDRKPNGKGRNFTVNIRMSREEIEAARKLGDGNISMGFRQAIRYACWKEMRPIKLSTMLRSASVMAAALEDGNHE
jgi:hypothetical protein